MHINIKRMCFFKSNGGSSGASRQKKGGAQKIDSVLSNIKPTDEYQKVRDTEMQKMINRLEKDFGIKATEADIKKVVEEIQRLTTSEDTHVSIRVTHANLKKILEDGRFKSQFETGTSKGFLDKDHRAKVEHNEMSYIERLSPELRPIYGLLFNYQKVSDLKISGGSSGEGYGGVVCIMKPQIKARTTITMNDSLDYHYDVSPSPLLRPSKYSISTEANSTYMIADAIKAVRSGQKLTLDMFKKSSYGYIEAQIHGGNVSTSNIQHVIYPKGTSIEGIPKGKLKEAGITWSIEGQDVIH